MNHTIKGILIAAAITSMLVLGATSVPIMQNSFAHKKHDFKKADPDTNINVNRNSADSSSSSNATAENTNNIDNTATATQSQEQNACAVAVTCPGGTTTVTPPPNPPPSEVGCDAAPFATLYNVRLDGDLNSEASQGDILCLSGNNGGQPLGSQTAFDVNGGNTFGVVADQPNHVTCSPPTVHATVESGNPRQGQSPLTSVCLLPSKG